MRKTTLSEGKPRRIKRCEYSVLLMYTGESEDLSFFRFAEQENHRTKNHHERNRTVDEKYTPGGKT